MEIYVGQRDITRNLNCSELLTFPKYKHLASSFSSPNRAKIAQSRSKITQEEDRADGISIAAVELHLARA